MSIHSQIDWTTASRRYLGFSVFIHLIWEVGQLPLYTIWTTDTWQRQVVAVLHCTVGDVMIAGLTLLAALSLFGTKSWTNTRIIPVYVPMLLMGVVYTIFSEWMNTTVRASWTYSDIMPIVPVFNIGLSPLLQWLIVPTLAMWAATGRLRRISVPTKFDSG